MSAVTAETARSALQAAVEALWLAVAELVLTASDDQPEQGELASAEDAAEVVVEVQGLVALARAELAGSAAVSSALPAVDCALRDATLRYWRDLRAHDPVRRLRASTRRRGGEWPSWWTGVEQSLARCECPLIDADRACAAAWLEVTAGSEPIRPNTPRRLP